MGKNIRITKADQDSAQSLEPGYDGRPPILVDVKNVRAVDGGRITANRNANHCTICWLHNRKHLTDLQHYAAEKLQDDHALAGLTCIPSTLAALASGGGHGGGTAAELANSKIDASKRRAAALMAAGTSGRFLLEQMVLNDKTAKDIAVILRAHEKSIVPSLRVALDGLIAHYNLKVTARDSGRVRTYHPFQQPNEEK